MSVTPSKAMECNQEEYELQQQPFLQDTNTSPNQNAYNNYMTLSRVISKPQNLKNISTLVTHLVTLNVFTEQEKKTILAPMKSNSFWKTSLMAALEAKDWNTIRDNVIEALRRTNNLTCIIPAQFLPAFQVQATNQANQEVRYTTVIVEADSNARNKRTKIIISSLLALFLALFLLKVFIKLARLT